MMKLLSARQIPAIGYRFRIHLDTTKLDADGNPDRDWCVQYVFGQQPPTGMTVANYRAACVAEAKALAAVELAKRADVAGTALAAEGEEF